MKEVYAVVTKDGVYGIRCGRCGLTSWNKHDVVSCFCANCGRFHDEAIHAAPTLVVDEQ